MACNCVTSDKIMKKAATLLKKKNKEIKILQKDHDELLLLNKYFRSEILELRYQTKPYFQEDFTVDIFEAIVNFLTDCNNLLELLKRTEGEERKILGNELKEKINKTHFLRRYK